jgi:hypothetical protein
MGGAGQPLDLQLHQALGGEADHLAQKIGIRALFQKRAKGHISSVIAGSSNQGGCCNPTLSSESTMTTAKPPARYGAIYGRAGGRLRCTELHHAVGHDLRPQRGRRQTLRTNSAYSAALRDLRGNGTL